MHVTIHSYNSSNNNAWIQTTIYFDNSTTKIPSRHYEKVKYFDTFSTVDDYSIVIGENAINGTDDNYYFMIDDFTILQGGTINSFNSDQSKVILLSEVKEIQNNGNCITKIGFNELNPAITDKSEYICVLCNDTFFNLKGECVDTSRCKIRDAEKRLCKGKIL